MDHKEILDNYRDEVVAALRELVSFRSVKAEPLEGRPFGEEIDKAYRYMLEKAEADGFAVFDADGYGGHIEWRGSLTDGRGEAIAAAEETVGVAVHLDVVPAGEGWTYDPWGGEISGGRMYGRGTADNKNAAAAVYYAMKALKDSGYVPAKNIRLLLGLDEESGWSGIDMYFERASAPDFGFAPDADFPAINGEKGFMVFEIAKKLEPGNESGLILRSVTGGNAANMVPDHSRAILVYEDAAEKNKKRPRTKAKASKEKAAAKAAGPQGGGRERAFALAREAAIDYRERTGAKLSCKGAGNALEISASGISAHGSRPDKGVNAISIIMDFLSGLPLANESARDFVDFFSTSIGSETDGKSLGVAMSDVPSGELVVNAGTIELNREAAILTVNIRYPVSRSEEEVYGAIMPILDENGLGVVKVSHMAPLFYAPDEPFIKALMDVYRKNTGDMQSQPIVIGGGTYARAFPKAVAFGPRFPGEEEVMHEKDEYVSLDSLMKSAHIYADALRSLAHLDPADLP